MLPAPSDALEDGLAPLLADLDLHLLHGVEDAQVLLLEVLKVLRQLLVPRVQDEDLEAERRGGDEEVGQRDGARHPHGGGGVVRMRGGGALFVRSAPCDSID